MKVRVTVFMADGPESTIYTRTLLDTTIDFCKVNSLLRSSPLIKSFLTNLLDCLEVGKIKCPYKKGLLRATNCKLSSFSVPEIPGGGDCKFKIIMASTVKLPTNKWVQLYRIEIYGIYKALIKSKKRNK